MLSDCYWWKMAVLFLPADCQKQLLARSLHSAHISPNNGVLQPVHIHERPEVCEQCPSFGDTAAGGRAAGGKTSVTVVSRGEILAGRQSGLWANTWQPVFLMFKGLLASFMLAGTFAVFQLHCSDSALSSRLSTLFFPLGFSSCCHGNHWLQSSVAMAIASRMKENERDGVETKGKRGVDGSSRFHLAF